MNWFDDTFLPSLFERWQNRDKQYPSIILTERQAYQCNRRMEQVNAYEVCKKYDWRGREVLLQQGGRYTFLSFGPTADEKRMLAIKEDEKRHQRRLEHLRRLRDKGSVFCDPKRRLAEYAEDAQRRIDEAESWLADPESDADDIVYYTTQIARAKEELEICTTK